MMLRAVRFVVASNFFRRQFVPHHYIYSNAVSGGFEKRARFKLFMKNLTSSTPLIECNQQLCNNLDLEDMENLFKEMNTFGINPNLNTVNLMMMGYAKAGKTDQTVALFDTMGEKTIIPNENTYKIVLEAVARGKGSKWMNHYMSPIFSKMNQAKFQVQPTLGAILSIFIKKNSRIGILLIVKMMREEKIMPNVIIINNLLGYFTKYEVNPKIVVQIYQYAKSHKMEPSPVTYMYVIMAYCDLNMGTEVAKTFLELTKTNQKIPENVYAAVIGFWGRTGKEKMALACYEQMKKSGVEETKTIHLSVVSTYISMDRLDLAEEHVKKQNYEKLNNQTFKILFDDAIAKKKPEIVMHFLKYFQVRKRKPSLVSVVPIYEYYLSKKDWNNIEILNTLIQETQLIDFPTNLLEKARNKE